MPTLGRDVSPVGFGAWGIGGPGGAFSWPAQEEAVSVDAIHAAAGAGIDWIDTAPAYGCGRSERLVGAAVATLERPPAVFTKAGISWDDGERQFVDLRPASLERGVTASLERLGVPRLELVQLHWPGNNRPAFEAALLCLDRMREQGLTAAIGICNCDLASVQLAQSLVPIAALQVPYSLLDRRVEEQLIEHCRATGLPILAYSPLQSGLLSGGLTRETLGSLAPDDWRRRDPMFNEPHLTEHLALVDRMRALAAARGASAADVAIAWVLRDPAISGAIVGMRTAAHARRSAAAAGVTLTRDEVRAIDAAVAEEIRLPPPPARSALAEVLPRESYS